jgi:hypothetical protein
MLAAEFSVYNEGSQEAYRFLASHWKLRCIHLIRPPTDALHDKATDSRWLFSLNVRMKL